MMEKTTIHVCTRCKLPDAGARSEGGTAGLQMRDMLGMALDREGLASRFRVEETSCLGGCSRRCRISVANPNRWSWLLSDLRPQDGADDIMQFLRDWEEADMGLIPKAERKAWLLTHAIGRLPPLR